MWLILTFSFTHHVKATGHWSTLPASPLLCRAKEKGSILFLKFWLIINSNYENFTLFSKKYHAGHISSCLCPKTINLKTSTKLVIDHTFPKIVFWDAAFLPSTAVLSAWNITRYSLRRPWDAASSKTYQTKTIKKLTIRTGLFWNVPVPLQQ